MSKIKEYIKKKFGDDNKEHPPFYDKIRLEHDKNMKSIDYIMPLDKPVGLRFYLNGENKFEDSSE